MLYLIDVFYFLVQHLQVFVNKALASEITVLIKDDLYLLLTILPQSFRLLSLEYLRLLLPLLVLFVIADLHIEVRLVIGAANMPAEGVET